MLVPSAACALDGPQQPVTSAPIVLGSLTGAAPLGNDVLARSLGSPPGPNADAISGATTSQNHVSLSPGAFRGASGVVQINGSAGVGNRSLNSVTLQLRAGP